MTKFKMPPRREEALRKLKDLPAFQETTLATTVAPTAVDHGAALLAEIEECECCACAPNRLRAHAEALIADLDTERNWLPYYETELQPLFEALNKLGAPNEPDTELHHQIEWLIEKLEKAEASAAEDFKLRAAADAKADSDADYIRVLEGRNGRLAERAEKAEKAEADFARCKTERDRAKDYLERQRLCGRLDDVLVTRAGRAEYNAALADEPDKP